MKEEALQSRQDRLVHSDTVETQSTIVSDHLHDENTEPFTVLPVVREERQRQRQEEGRLGGRAMATIKLKMWLEKYGLR